MICHIYNYQITILYYPLPLQKQQEQQHQKHHHQQQQQHLQQQKHHQQPQKKQVKKLYHLWRALSDIMALPANDHANTNSTHLKFSANVNSFSL